MKELINASSIKYKYFIIVFLRSAHKYLFFAKLIYKYLDKKKLIYKYKKS
jgi:hypothetical protein